MSTMFKTTIASGAHTVVKSLRDTTLARKSAPPVR